MKKATSEDKKRQKALVIENNGDMFLLLDFMLGAKLIKLVPVKNLMAAKNYLKTT